MISIRFTSCPSLKAIMFSSTFIWVWFTSSKSWSSLAADDDTAAYQRVFRYAMASYVGDALAARMCLYRREDEHAPIFDPPHDYMVIWKLEVLEKYRGRGFGSKLIDYAKSYGIPDKGDQPAELPRILRDPWLRAPEIRHRTRYVGRSTDLVSGRLCTQLKKESRQLVCCDIFTFIAAAFFTYTVGKFHFSTVWAFHHTRH